MTRNALLAAAGVGVIALGLAGWTVAGVLRPSATPPSGRLLQVRYQVVPAPAYVPPPPTEATRIDVLGPEGPSVIEEGVLAAEAAQAFREQQAADEARTAAAAAALRAEDARVDRETSAALGETQREAAEPPVLIPSAPRP